MKQYFFIFLFLFPVLLLSNILDSTFGIRNRGLNSAYTALVNNTESVFVNPASLGFMNKLEISFDYFSHYNNIPIYNGGFVLPFSTKPKSKKKFLENLTIGLDVLSGGLKNIDIYDSVGNVSDILDYSFSNLKIGAGINLIKNRYWEISPGIGFSFYKDTINDETLKKIYIDYSLLSIIHFDKQFFLYPFFGSQLRIGVVKSKTSLKLAVALKLFKFIFCDVDLKYLEGEYNSIHIGIEKWFWKRLALRTGIGIGYFSDKWTGGVSFALVRHNRKRLFLEVSKIFIGDLTDSLSFGLKYRW